MPRWLRVVRGMIGTGLTFAAGVGVVASITGALVWLGHGITGREMLGIVGKCSVVAFLLGVAFSGVLAITARGRPHSYPFQGRGAETLTQQSQRPALRRLRGRQQWAARFGMVVDRFGIPWLVNCEGSAAPEG
jgi:hypothetical protein